MKKILINATGAGYKLNGIGIYSVNIVKNLLKICDNIQFEVLINSSAFSHFNFLSSTHLKIFPSFISPDYGSLSHLLRLIYSNIFVKLKNNLFVTSQFEGNFLCKNQVITVQDIIPLLFKKEYPRQYFFFRYLLPLILNSSKAIITPSFHTKNLLVRHYKIEESKIYVVYYGIDDRFFKNALKKEDKQNYILFVGRLSPVKNIAGLLKAFSLISKKISDLKLIVIGDGPEHPSKNSQIKKLCNENVIFKGNVSSDELLCFYKNAKMFIFPSFYEGFGFPPLEAMASGCPCIVSNTSSLPEVCSDAAEYVNPHSTEDIADKIYNVIANENIRDTLVEKGRERVKLFRWENTAKEHLNIFKKIFNFEE